MFGWVVMLLLVSVCEFTVDTVDGKVVMVIPICTLVSQATFKLKSRTKQKAKQHHYNKNEMNNLRQFPDYRYDVFERFWGIFKFPDLRC